MGRKAFTSSAHPWHGIPAGSESIINCFIEIVPTDSVKYEIDKDTGLLKLDRPQKYSSRCPSLYGFVPRTYCGRRVGEYCSSFLDGSEEVSGDGDPLDIIVLTEKPITHGNLLVTAVPIGGLRMIDKGQADDKIIAVLKGDIVYGKWRDIKECPPSLLARLNHYFLTYKDFPGTDNKGVKIVSEYGAEEAKEVFRLSIEDYREEFY